MNQCKACGESYQNSPYYRSDLWCGGCDQLPIDTRCAMARLLENMQSSCNHCDQATNGAHEHNCQAHPDHTDSRPPAPICPDCSRAIAAVDGCRSPRMGEQMCEC